MNLNRLLACAAGLVVAALAFYAYQEYIHLLGFHDGHVTELGAAEKKLALVFVGLSLLVVLCLTYLGVIAGRRKVGRMLTVASVVYVLVLAGTVAVDWYLQSRLDNGIGG